MDAEDHLARVKTVFKMTSDRDNIECPSPVLLSGSYVIKGSGLMITCSVG
jgi:hypothetical protein